MMDTKTIHEKLLSYNLQIPIENVKLEYENGCPKYCVIIFTMKQYDESFSLFSNEIGISKGWYLDRKYPSPYEQTDKYTAYYEVIHVKDRRIRPYEFAESEPYRLYGLISPDGEFFKCDYAGHIYLLSHLLAQGEFIHMMDEYAADELSGWVKLTGAMMSECEFTFKYNAKFKSWSLPEPIIFKNKITDAQRTCMRKYLKARNQKEFNFNYEDYNIEEFDNVINDANNE